MGKPEETAVPSNDYEYLYVGVPCSVALIFICCASPQTILIINCVVVEKK